MNRFSILRLMIALLSTIIFMVSKPAHALSVDIHRVSVSSTGEQANDMSGSATLSANGRYVIFASSASNLVSNDTNGSGDVFVHDMQNGATTLVSVSSVGEEGNGSSGGHAMSADGRYIAFASGATNLVANDTNGIVDIFVHDVQTGITTRVNISSSGVEANDYTYSMSMSGDGRYVAFDSVATNLIPDDTDGTVDIFIHDRITGATTLTVSGGENPSLSYDGRFIAFIAGDDLVPTDNGLADVYVRDLQTGNYYLASVSSSGEHGDQDTLSHPSISSNGQFVAFYSNASNLVPNDTNGWTDVFVHDMQTSITTRVNVSSQGAQTNFGWSWSYAHALSGDGRFVTFQSSASNLVPNDTNNAGDTFVHDMQTGVTAIMSLAYDGAQGVQGTADAPAFSADGRFVGFHTSMSNLVPNDTNSTYDVFVTANTLFPPTPANAAPVINYYAELPFRLTWSRISWATGYEVEIATTPNFGASVILNFNTAADELQVAVPSLSNGHFFWRVRAKKSNGEGATWGAANAFDIQAS